MTYEPSTHPCAVCPKPIRRGQLMCLSHWKLVPQDQQRAVTRTWGLFSRAKSAVRSLERRKDYLAARDAAVTCAQAALAGPLTAAPESLRPDATP